MTEQWAGKGAAAACLHELFEAQVARDPDAIALVYGQTRLSYSELNRRSHQLAYRLRKRGVTAETRVALCFERGAQMVIGLLAILKAGGAYVPLDPSYPAAHLAYIVRDSAPRVLLTHSDVSSTLRAEVLALAGSPQLPTIDLDRLGEPQEADVEPHPRPIELLPGQLAYVIYTSGSSGQPKGVMVTHANVVQLFLGCGGQFRFNKTDVWSLFHSISFDFSIWELWGALLHGGSLLIVPRAVARAPEQFYELLCKAGATVLSQTPSAFRSLMAAQPESGPGHALRYILFGGEELDVTSLRPWYARPQNRNTRLCNLYGITETTVHATCRHLEPRDSEFPDKSIGRRLSHLRAYLLDARGRPVPLGVSGEICIAGAGVSRGYLKRPALTAERFIPDPFDAGCGGRLYRSGDLGRWQADGTLEFLGRNDAQVKIRGFRIEPAEIESRLCEHPGVREAIVVAQELAPGDKRLVAYYTTRGVTPADFPDPQALRAHIAAVLPQFMIPAAYIRLDLWPLTASGKLDRRALPPPGQSTDILGGYEEPQGEIEIALARMWEDLLKVKRVGRRAHFFAMGGDSLLATQLTARIQREFEVSIALTEVFADPVVAPLAEKILNAQLARYTPEDLAGLMAGGH